MEYDAFICHASEDKEDFVRPLAEMLKQHYLDVWYDEFSLKIGDSLSQKIDEGLSNSRYGIVVLSQNFFKKPWAKRELSGLISREMSEDNNLILPIWHRVSKQDVLQFSPPLADKKAASSSHGINVLVRNLIKKIKPTESPLIVAREELVKLKVEVPPISDDWWLNLVEYKEFLKFPDINANKRWIFPLPYQNEDSGLKRGMNIASTALQLDWSFEGEELNISPLTHPEIVHKYIHRWPGLYDCAKKNPGILAMYVPQLTIPGFDNGFENEFNSLLGAGNINAELIFSYGPHNTIDDQAPLCGDIIALRHETFGNYTPEELGHWYFNAHDSTYIRSNWSIFEGLVWLFSSGSNWLPEKFKKTFSNGIIARDIWATSCSNTQNEFIKNLFLKNRKSFKLSTSVRLGLIELVGGVINSMNLPDNPKNVSSALLEAGLVEKFYEYADNLKKRRQLK